MTLPTPQAAAAAAAALLLQVTSEDTVLFTAQAYMDQQPAGDAKQLAAAKLAPLLRCPHLSQFWLSVSVLADHAGEQLLGALQPQLKRLLLRKLACSPQQQH